MSAADPAPTATQPARPITYLGLALALIGPGLVALGSRWAAHGKPSTLAIATPWLALFVVLTGAVWAIAVIGEGVKTRDLGFRRIGWLTLPIAIALAAFFILAFGPAAYWFLVHARLPSFAGGESTLALLPKWFLILDVVLVAASEEWLYRAYAIERLQALVGRPWLAGLISLAAFGLAHLPLWGPGVALTTLVSGGIITALYIWRRDIVALIIAHVITDLYGLVIAR